jgi:hypothetical protein
MERYLVYGAIRPAIAYDNRPSKGGNPGSPIIKVQLKDDTIVLLASGDLDENEDMRRLVEYYEKLGFEMINPENLEEDLESVTMSVPMKGTVENILNKTMSRFPLVSPEFLDVLKKLV